MDEGLGERVLGAYCERGMDPSFWAEPVNAVTNLGFVVAGVLALVLWRRDPAVAFLAAVTVTVAIGIGSFLFHTMATRAAMIADVAPIQLFIAGYFLLAMRRFVGLGWLAAACATAAFMALAAMIPAILPDSAPWRGLGGYAGGLLGLLGLGGFLVLASADRRTTGWALLGVAGLFAVSLTFRTIDGAVCAYLPTGTHAAWHILNALTLFALMGIMARRPAFDPIQR